MSCFEKLANHIPTDSLAVRSHIHSIPERCVRRRDGEDDTSVDIGDEALNGFIFLNTAIFVGLGVHTPIVGENTTAHIRSRSE